MGAAATPAVVAAMAPEIAAGAGMGGGLAALFGATGAASPIAASLLASSATPFVTGAPAVAGIGGGSAASAFGPLAGATEMLGPGLLGLGSPPAAGSSIPWNRLAKAGLSVMNSKQQAPTLPAPTPPKGDSEELQKAIMAWLMAGKVDPRMKQQLMLAMRGGR